jgi:hypothetical protein
MALPSATCTVADGGAPAVTVSNSTIQVTPGNVITVALSNSAGVQQMIARARFSDDPLLASFYFQSITATSFTFTAPAQPFKLNLDVSVTDSFNNYTSNISIQGGLPQNAQSRQVRNTIVAALAAYTNVNGVLTANSNVALVQATMDGVVNVAGDRVLLNGLVATAADAGIYQVVSVGSGSAPWVLQRAGDWFQGEVIPPAAVVEVSEGTQFSNSSWKATVAGLVTVGTSAPAFYPRVSKFLATMVAGAVTNNTTAWLLSTTTSQINATINTQAGTTTFISCPVASRVAGIAGTGAIKVQGGGSDTSTVDVVATNWS